MKVKAKHFCLIYDADMINLRLSVSSVCTLCGFFFQNVYLDIKEKWWFFWKKNFMSWTCFKVWKSSPNTQHSIWDLKSFYHELFLSFQKKVNTRKGASINYVHKHKDGFTQISTILLHKLMQSTCQRKVSESSKPVNVVYRYPKEKVASTSTL